MELVEIRWASPHGRGAVGLGYPQVRRTVFPSVLWWRHRSCGRVIGPGRTVE